MIQLNWKPAKSEGSCAPDPVIVHVCVPGHVKSIPLSLTHESMLLTAQYRTGGTDGKRRTGIDWVDLSPVARECGFLLLKEEFDKDERPEAYELYKRWESTLASVPANRRADMKKKNPFEPLLPASVKELNKRKDAPPSFDFMPKGKAASK